MTAGADAWGRSVSGSGAGWQAGPAWQRLGVAGWAGSSAWGLGRLLCWAVGRGSRPRKVKGIFRFIQKGFEPNSSPYL